MGTDDDLALSRIDRIWEDAFESFGGKLEEFGNRMERLQHRSVHFDHSGHSVWWDCHEGEEDEYRGEDPADDFGSRHGRLRAGGPSPIPGPRQVRPSSPAPWRSP